MTTDTTDLATVRVAATSIGEGLRQSILARLRSGERDAAMQCARQLLTEQPGLPTWRFLRKAAESDEGRSALRSYKIALLSSFSIEFLHDALIAYGFANGYRLSVHQGGYATFRQELLDEQSAVYEWRPDVIVLAVERAAWIPDADVDRTESVHAFGAELQTLLASVRAQSNAPVLVHNFEVPAWRPLGVLDIGQRDGETAYVQRLNDMLRDVASAAPSVHVVDYAGLVNLHGALRWNDDRMRLYARAPIAQPMLAELAREYLKFIRCLSGSSRKCLVLDLDNTLWGGVVGEEGPDGIELGATYPGSAYLEFQRHVLALHRRGVILAVATKNNPGDVDEVFARNKALLLRKEHFADMQVHWGLKSESLRAIAGKLGISLEHIVFADDNPAECEEVRMSLPMVTVLQLPPQPEHYVRALHEDGWFDMLALSGEDLKRGELYRQRALGEALRTAAGGVEEYYRALDMKLTVSAVTSATLKRAAQLTQKTNQLNVTTRRYSEAQLAALVADSDWECVTVGVVDRFGDNGIVGLLLARLVQGALHIDTLLLSCRVMGRGIETAMLAHACDRAGALGCSVVTGEFVPTSKNMPVRDLFPRHGFERIAGDDEGPSTWRLPLPERRVPWPDWVRTESGVTERTMEAVQ